MQSADVFFCARKSSEGRVKWKEPVGRLEFHPANTSPPATVTLRFVPDRVRMFLATMGLPDLNGSKLPNQLLSLGLTLHDTFRRVLML